MLKKYALNLFALCIAFAAVAFTHVPSEVPANAVVWQFEQTNSNDPKEPLNYIRLDQTTSFDCNNGSTVCHILAEEDQQTQKPIIPMGDDPSVQVQKYETSFRTE